MRYRAVLLDVDGVLTPFRSAWQRIHGVLGLDAAANRAMYAAGLIDYYDWALVDVLMWRGVPRSFVEAPFQIRRGLEALCRVLASSGVYAVAVSAGVGYTRRLSSCFHAYIVNDLLYIDGGIHSVSVSVSDGNKDQVASRVLELLGVEWGEVVAVGDSETDLPILRRAAFPIAFNPTSPQVERAARAVIRSETLYPLARYLSAILSDDHSHKER